LRDRRHHALAATDRALCCGTVEITVTFDGRGYVVVALSLPFSRSSSAMAASIAGTN
jgi:hypothetical protein